MWSKYGQVQLAHPQKVLVEEQVWQVLQKVKKYQNQHDLYLHHPGNFQPFNFSMYNKMSSFKTLPSLPVAGTVAKLI